MENTVQIRFIIQMINMSIIKITENRRQFSIF